MNSGKPDMGSVVRPADPEKAIAVWVTKNDDDRFFTRIRRAQSGLWEAMVVSENLGGPGLVCVLPRTPTVFESIEIVFCQDRHVNGKLFQDKYLIELNAQEERGV